MNSKNKLLTETLKFATEDRLLSWYYLISTFLITVLAFAGIYFSQFIILKIFFGILAGLLIARLFVIYHDFQHRAILKESMLGAVIMKCFGLLTLAPSSIWNETHQHHHHSNSRFSTFVVGSFPTITVQAYQGLNKAQKFKYKVIRHPLMIAFAYIPIFLVSFCLWPFFENPKKYFDCGVAAVIHGLIAYCLYLFGGISDLFYFLLLPSLVTFSIGGYIFYAQHNFSDVILKNDDEWDYLEAALYSSSFIRMNGIMKWFTANIGYHHIHHVNSRIPFYRLPEVMDHFQELQQPKSTSLHPKEIWRCLQLKLWDEKRGRMIAMNELEN